EGRSRLLALWDGVVEVDSAGIRQKVRNRDDPPPLEHVDRAVAVRDVRGRADDGTGESLREGDRDRVGPCARDEDVAVELEELLRGPRWTQAVLDKPLAVAPAQLEELVDVEPGRVREETVDGAHPDETCSRPYAGTRRPGSHLSEAFDREGRTCQAPAEVAESCFGSRLDPVPG